MDDVRSLRRTVRRCTAVVVAALGLNLTAVTDPGTLWGGVLFVAAVGYLVASGFVSFVVEAGPSAGTETEETAQDDHGT